MTKFSLDLRMAGATILSSAVLPAHWDGQKGIQTSWGSISDAIFDRVTVPGPGVVCTKPSKSQFLQGFVSPLKMNPMLIIGHHLVTLLHLHCRCAFKGNAVGGISSNVVSLFCM